MRLERAFKKQSSDTRKTPNDRVKRWRERKKYIKASEHDRCCERRGISAEEMDSLPLGNNTHTDCLMSARLLCITSRRLSTVCPSAVLLDPAAAGWRLAGLHVPAALNTRRGFTNTTLCPKRRSAYGLALIAAMCRFSRVGRVVTPPGTRSAPWVTASVVESEVDARTLNEERIWEYPCCHGIAVDREWSCTEFKPRRRTAGLAVNYKISHQQLSLPYTIFCMNCFTKSQLLYKEYKDHPGALLEETNIRTTRLNVERASEASLKLIYVLWLRRSPVIPAPIPASPQPSAP
ncbi:hypothetical protein PR048_017536 [Dryococelus australis]|uniref:Uncharacterized protein n=1 Tax=Dryococelus australis TaxID=614101 RepID=A0ABQ9HAE3_9NEOP|nr:hypothetical protein PR048_017536 [Dryococelus australis]